jgi:hypothetical protein
MVQRIRDSHWGNEFLGLLMHRGVRFVLVGVLAVGVHDHERYTKDLGILVDPQRSRRPRLGKALTEFGFSVIGRRKSQEISCRSVPSAA